MSEMLQERGVPARNVRIVQDNATFEETRDDSYIITSPQVARKNSRWARPPPCSVSDGSPSAPMRTVSPMVLERKDRKQYISSRDRSSPVPMRHWKTEAVKVFVFCSGESVVEYDLKYRI